MAGIMRDSDFRYIVEPLYNDAFDGVYEQRKDEYKAFLRTRDGAKRQYSEEATLYGLGMAPELPDGQPVVYRGGGVLFNTRYIYLVYGLAYALTKTLVEDGEHISIGRIYAEHLAQALIETKETVAANILNRATNASYPIGDGKALAASDHPIYGGTASNILSTAAALSQSALEQLLIQIHNTVDNDGKRITLTGKELLVNPANMFQGEVILKSILAPGSANNALNPINSLGMIEGGVKTVTRQTSTTQWGIRTAVRKGMTLMMRREVQRSMEGDFDTDTMRYKATTRYAVGTTDWRDYFMSAGA
jgi:hypothetical protein